MLIIIDREVGHVAWLITDAAHKTLPLLKPSKTNRFKDRTLSQLSVLCGEKSVIE